jgi:glycosyltransferase involved in cell wall biosynthesis
MEGGRSDGVSLSDGDATAIEQRYRVVALKLKDHLTERDTLLHSSERAAQRSFLGLRVTIDATCLRTHPAGVQMHTLELTTALAKALPREALRVIISPEIGEYARRRLESLESVELVYVNDLNGSERCDDVIHRPYHLDYPGDLKLLRRLGERVVISQQDVIQYRNHTCWADYESWERSRVITRYGLSGADMVLFVSEHAALDALSEGLVDASRIRVMYSGVDQPLARSESEWVPPRDAGSLRAGNYLLCIGTDYHSKNRLFALRVLQHLCTRHGWSGKLVLVGARAVIGSSSQDEERFIEAHPGLADHVSYLRYVGEAEKGWLYANARAVLHPATYEGFGVVPFEAASVGVPCAFAWQTAFTELLPRELATLVAWDPVSSAERLYKLISDRELSARLVSEIGAIGERFTWRRAAMRALECYEEVLTMPPRRLAGEARLEQLPSPGVLPGSRWWELPAKTVSVLFEDGFRGLGPHLRYRFMRERLRLQTRRKARQRARS